MSGTWNIPLSSPPRVRAISLGTHGPGRLTHRMHGLWQVHFYPYATTAIIGGEPLAIRPGCAGVTPPGAIMAYELTQRSTHAYAHFALSDGPLTEAPALVDLGRNYERLEAALLAAAGWVEQAPDRATARLWDIMWQVIAAAPAEPGKNLIARARDRIEMHLPAAIRIEDIADELDCTHAHLSRAFHASMGTTIIAYIRRRRVDRAVYLLQSSSLPIAEIAKQVGVADLQAFNKLLRREIGTSPRAMRHAINPL